MILLLHIIVAILVVVVTIGLHVAVYAWTRELEKAGCECSNLWHRNVVQVLAMVKLVVIPLNAVLRNKYLMFCSAIVSLVYFALIIDYVRQLKAKECECSEDWKRDFAYIYSTVWYVMTVLMVLVSLFLLSVGVGTGK